MKHLSTYSRRALAGLASGLLLASTATVARAEQPDMEHGNVWSRILQHYDGTMTKSFKDTKKERVIEEKFDAKQVLIQKRLFLYDKSEHLRMGIIMDAKGNALGSTKYGYDSYDRINEERLYDAKGRLIQRKFPPGTLPGVEANQKYSVSFTIDPNNPEKLGAMKQSRDPIIMPTNSEADNFVPGVPTGDPPPPAQAAPPSKPESNERKGFLKPKAAPKR